MELRQFLPGGKGSNIIAGEQGVVYAVQMGSNDGGVRCFFADYFYVIQIHNQAAHGHGRLTAVEDDHIRVVGINGLRHAVKIYSVPGKVQRFVLALQHIATGFTKIRHSFQVVPMSGGAGRSRDFSCRSFFLAPA